MIEEQDMQQLKESQPPKPVSAKQVIEIFGCETTKIPTEATVDHHMMLEEIKELDSEIKVMEERKQFLKDKICSDMLTSDTLIDDSGIVIATWKRVETKRFDSTKFKKDMPELADKYTATKETRQFLIKR